MKNCSEREDSGFLEDKMLQEMEQVGWEQQLSGTDLESGFLWKYLMP